MTDRGAPADLEHELAPDGWRLGVRWCAPVGPARGVVILLHAMMVDARSFERAEGPSLVRTLLDHGWQVGLADFRGHGQSGPTPAQGGVWTYDDLVYKDVPTFIAAARRRTDGPVVVMGHSLGGHVTLASMACGASQPDALVCLAANVWLDALEPDGAVAWAKWATLGGFSLVNTLAGGFPARRFGVGPADEAQPYVADLVRYGRQGRWGSRDGRHDWGAMCAAVATPVLSVLASGDRLLARPAGAARWAWQVPGAQVWLVGSGAYGVRENLGHMALVTDPRAAPAWEHIATWADGCLRPN